jgi:hypothetical protein
VNLELVKATANCRLSGPSGSQPQRRRVPQIGQERGFNRTFNPLAQVQFREGAFQEFSQSLQLPAAFENEDSLPRRRLGEGGSTKCQTANAKRLVRV